MMTTRIRPRDGVEEPTVRGHGCVVAFLHNFLILQRDCPAGRGGDPLW
jgi:hypothetical protein